MCDVRTCGHRRQCAGHDQVTGMHKSLHSQKYAAIFLNMLRQARAAAEMTQEDLADALGVERTVVTKVENGVRRLDTTETYEWVRCLGVTFSDFAAELEQELIALELRNSAGRRRVKRLHPAGE